MATQLKSKFGEEITFGIPYNKVAMVDAAVLEFVKEVKPHGLHFLGGEVNEIFAMNIAAESPGTLYL